MRENKCDMKIKKIAILDGFTSVRDDLDWHSLDAIAEVSAYDRTPPALVLERCADADAVLTNKVVLNAEHFAKLPNLKYVGVLATGYNNVDLKAARGRGIDITNIPAYSTDSVAQSVFAHILNIAEMTELHAQAVCRGEWTSSKDVFFCLGSLTELAGLTIGIIGYGAIGKAVARIAKAFGMSALAYTPRLKVGDSDANATFASLDDIFGKSDIVSLNCPLNASTDRIINAENIAKMKDGAWIINTGRGGLVDEQALADALKSGKIGAAGVDVLSVEPPPSSNPLIGAPNCRITPHTAWTKFAARKRLIKIARDNLAAWVAGKPVNVVNP